MTDETIMRKVPLRALFGATISSLDLEIKIHCFDHDVRDEILDYLLGEGGDPVDAPAPPEGGK